MLPVQFVERRGLSKRWRVDVVVMLFGASCMSKLVPGIDEVTTSPASHARRRGGLFGQVKILSKRVTSTPQPAVTLGAQGPPPRTSTSHGQTYGWGVPPSDRRYRRSRRCVSAKPPAEGFIGCSRESSLGDVIYRHTGGVPLIGQGVTI